MKYSRGARMLLIVATLIVVAVCVFLIIYREGGEESFTRDVVHTDKGLSVLENIDPETDSDNDGLKDWQEALWQTDPQNPDTDGDGTPDGEEVREGRSPVNGESDDELNLKEYKQSNSLTEQVAQNIYSQYSLVSQQGAPLTATTQQAIVESSLENSDLHININTKTLSDVFADPEYTNYKEYANRMGQLLITYARKTGDPSVSSIMQSSLLESDPSILEQLNTHESRYASLIDNALDVRVPIALVNSHLLFINSLESTRASISALSESAVDPFKGIVGLNIYTNSVQASADAIEELKIFYTHNNITLEENETGYVFLYGL